MRACPAFRLLTIPAMLVALTAATGCKTFTERYIALEVWKYERCFGHLPPGFTPPGAAPAAVAPPRVCGQQPQCCESAAPMNGCGPCEGGGTVIEGGLPAGAAVPAGPGGSPGPAPATAPSPVGGVTAGKPVVISDEVVIP